MLRCRYVFLDLSASLASATIDIQYTAAPDCEDVRAARGILPPRLAVVGDLGGVMLEHAVLFVRLALDARGVRQALDECSTSTRLRSWHSAP